MFSSVGSEPAKKSDNHLTKPSDVQEIPEIDQRVQAVFNGIREVKIGIGELQQEQQELRTQGQNLAAQVNQLVEDEKAEALERQKPKPFDWKFYGIMAFLALGTIVLVIAAIALIILCV